MEYKELVDYYKGLIRLRKHQPGLCDKRAEAAGRVLEKSVLSPGVVTYHMDNRPQEQPGMPAGNSKCTPKELFVIYNASDSAAEIKLPQGVWSVLADGQRADYGSGAGSEVCGETSGKPGGESGSEAAMIQEGRIFVPACSGMILGIA